MMWLREDIRKSSGWGLSHRKPDAGCGIPSHPVQRAGISRPNHQQIFEKLPVNITNENPNFRENKNHNFFCLANDYLLNQDFSDDGYNNYEKHL